MDAGAWVALTDEEDHYHRDAVAAYPQLLRDYGRLITSNLVVAEAYTIVRRTAGHRQAMALLRAIKASPRIENVYSTQELEDEAEAILDRYDDQSFSLTDAVSFALMKRRGIRTAFAFDRLFSAAGFGVFPTPSRQN